MERLYNIGLQIACLVVSLVLYWLLWGSVGGFVKAVDQGGLLFGDFIIHYYPMGEQFSSEQLPVGGFLYSAFFASILAVLAQLPLNEAKVIWGGLQIAAAVWLYAITAGSVLGLGKRNRALLLLLFLTSLPLLHNFKWGQVSVFVTLSIVQALVWQQRGRSAMAGLILAVAASVKYYPGVLLVYFLIQRDWRFIITFALGVLACYCLLPMLLLGVEGWSNFTTQSIANFPTYHTFLGNAGSQYFVHVIVRWAHNLGVGLTETAYHVLRWSGVVLFAGHIGLAEWFRRRGGKRAAALSATTVLLALPLVVPSSWPHYFVYLPLCQMTLALWISESTIGAWGRCLMGLLLTVSIAASSIFVFQAFPQWRLYYNVGVVSFADLLALLTLYGMAIALWLQQNDGDIIVPFARQESLGSGCDE